MWAVSGRYGPPQTPEPRSEEVSPEIGAGSAELDDPANPGRPRVSSQAWAFARDRCARCGSHRARGRAASERSEIVTTGLTYQAQTVIYS
jgi:hypothetical protein